MDGLEKKEVDRAAAAARRPTERELGIKQIPYRVALHDKAVMLKLLADDGLTFQTFMDGCVQAYLHGDPTVVRLVREWKIVSAVPRWARARSVLSARERAAILDELERGEREARVVDAEEDR